MYFYYFNIIIYAKKHCYYTYVTTIILFTRYSTILNMRVIYYLLFCRVC